VIGGYVNQYDQLIAMCFVCQCADLRRTRVKARALMAICDAL